MVATAIYMNQNRKMVRATPNAASTMMTTITPPAMAPASFSLVALLPGAGALPGEVGSAKHIYALYNMLYAGLEDVRMHDCEFIPLTNYYYFDGTRRKLTHSSEVNSR